MRIISICAWIIIILLVLFVPIPMGIYKDGGTKVYSALTYKIVKWNRLIARQDENGEWIGDTYSKTVTYWFPNNFKSIDELWEIEQKNVDTVE